MRNVFYILPYNEDYFLHPTIKGGMSSPSYHIMRGETIAAARMRNQDQARPLIPEADLQKIFLLHNLGLGQIKLAKITSELRRKWP